jgi:hypothetical protein
MDIKEAKMINPIAFFEVQHDSILSYDFENLKDPVPIIIKKPEGYPNYAYSYFFFEGATNAYSKGMTNILLCDYKGKNPHLYIDRNNNYDFTDDSTYIVMPRPYYINDTIAVVLHRPEEAQAGIAIHLSRISYVKKMAYRDMMNEYFQTQYPNRKFIGMDYCFREQRLNIKEGIVRTLTDSFKLALMDGNGNGYYGDIGQDKLLIANLQDSFFDSRNELQSFVITKDKNDLFFEKNGVTYQVLNMDMSGTFLTLILPDTKRIAGIEKGKKVKRFKFYDWEGKKWKIRKFKKKLVFIYLTSPHAKDFMKDTIALRAISTEFSEKIQVVGFIDVDKSYELRIFGAYTNLNWIAAYKDKYVIRDLQLHGVPASLWLAPKRKVIRYNISPQELLLELRQAVK